MMPFHADYAIYTKRSGSAGEYRVLAWSRGAWDVDSFQAVFDRLGVGAMPSKDRAGFRSPGTTEDAPDPPWFTFGAAIPPHSDVPYIIAIRQEWTDRYDVEGRQIAARSCLCVPFRELAAAPVSYQSLAIQIPSLDGWEPSHSRELDPVVLTLPSPDAAFADLAAAIELRGFAQCAALAALLLDGPVTLLRSTSSPTGDQMGWPASLEARVEDRLAWLDAIAGLLPYGVRAELSLSTWFDRTSTTTIRLGFSSGETGTQRSIEWGKDPRSLLVNGSVAYRYYDTLLRLVQRYSTLAVVTYLSQQGAIQSFATPAKIAQALGALDRPFQVLQGVRDRTATADEVRALFTTGTPGGLTEAEQRELLAFLLRRLRRQDVEIVHSHWQPALWDELCRVTAARLKAAPDDPASLRLPCEVAERVGRLVDLFLVLLGSMANPPPGDNDGTACDTVLTLLLDTSRLVSDTPEAPRLDQDWRLPQALATDPRLLIRFLSLAANRIVRTPEAATGAVWFHALERIVPSARPFVSLFGAAAGLSTADVSLEAVRTLTQVDARSVWSLFMLASHNINHDSTRLEHLLPGLSAWLLSDVFSAPNPERDRWQQTLANRVQEMAFGHVSSAFQARFDLFVLLLDSHPDRLRRPFVYDLLPHPIDQFRPYTDELVRQLAVLQRVRIEITSAMADLVCRVDCASEQCAENLIDLLVALKQLTLLPPAAERVDARIYHSLERFPRLVTEARARLVRGGHQLLQQASLRAGLSPATTVEQAAASCATYLQKNPTGIASVIDLLATCESVHDVRAWRHFLAQLTQALAAQQRSPDEIGHIAWQLKSAALEGKLSSGLATGYAQALLGELDAGLAHIQQLLPLLAPYLTAADRARLESSLTAAQDSVAAKSRSRWWRR